MDGGCIAAQEQLPRRSNKRIASYETVLATQSIGKDRPIEIPIRDRVKYLSTRYNSTDVIAQSIKIFLSLLLG
jgi:hypothetical protein